MTDLLSWPVVGAVLPALALFLLPRFRRIDEHCEPVPELLSLFSNIALMVAILLWRPQGVYPVTNR